MGGDNNFNVQPQIILPSGAKTASFTADKDFSSKTARVIEIWIDVTAVSGTTPNLDIILETSVLGLPFVQQDTVTGIIAAATNTLVINRADDALGTTARVRGVITGTTPSFTLSIVAVRME